MHKHDSQKHCHDIGINMLRTSCCLLAMTCDRGVTSVMCCSSASDRGRFSYFGGRGGPLWQRISYQLPAPPAPPSMPQHHSSSQHPKRASQHVDAHDSVASLPAQLQHRPTAGSDDQRSAKQDPCRQTGLKPGSASPLSSSSSALAEATHSVQQLPGTLTVEDSSHCVTQQNVSIWHYLRNQLHQHKIQLDEETAQQLPFDFWGGYVGYLGYELKAECGGDSVHQSSSPDAAMFLADR